MAITTMSTTIWIGTGPSLSVPSARKGSGSSERGIVLPVESSSANPPHTLSAPRVTTKEFKPR
jgi:hypothetical protein